MQSFKKICITIIFLTPAMSRSLKFSEVCTSNEKRYIQLGNLQSVGGIYSNIPNILLAYSSLNSQISESKDSVEKKNVKDVTIYSSIKINQETKVSMN